MTKREWLTSATAAPLWEHTKEHAWWTPRKLRLFVAAFWSWQAERLGTERAKRDLRRRAKAFEVWAETGKPGRWRVVNDPNVIFFNESPHYAASRTITAPASHWGEGWESCVAIMPQFLREVFGNPFRPVTFEPAWRSDTAVSLAKHIYKAYDFEQMPILADALQDAGCENADVLNHCRDPQQVHVRGCWVLDGVLGKV